MKKIQLLRLLFSVTVVAIFAVYFVLNLDSFKSVLTVNIFYLFLIALCVMIGIVSNGIFTKVILRSFDKVISIQESVFVSLIAAAGNFFAPAGSGFGFRAIYLKKKHKLAYSDYVSILSGNYVMVFLITSIIGVVALAMLSDKMQGQASIAYITLWAAFLGLLVVSLALLFIKIPRRFIKQGTRHGIIGKIIAIIARISDGWLKITSDRILMLKLMLLIIGNMFVSTLALAFIMFALGFQFTLPGLLLFSALNSLATFINITPANLGIKEAVYIASSSVLGFTTAEVLSIALIDRVVLFVVLAVLWVLFGRSTRLIQEKRSV